MPQLAHSVADLAALPAVRSCLDWFRRERAWVNEQHVKLCRIPAPTFFEQKRAEWMAERFRALGWETRLDRAGNLVASRPGRRDSVSVAVTAHLDTVLAPRLADEIKVTSDGRLLGPGVSDNGAGLAALLAIAAAWSAELPLEGTPLAPLLVANVGEEGEGNLSGMRYLCRPSNGARLRAFLVLDGPSTDRVTCRALASRRFDVTFTGPGGHSWSDYGIGNPVHALSRAVTLFTDQAPNGDGPRSSYNFGLIEGGSSINSIPSGARAKVDLRSESTDRIEQMAALLSSSVERALEAENGRSAGGRLTARVKEIGSRPGGGLSDDAPILECLRAVDAHLGIRSHLDCSSTDANIPLSLGLPAVSIGAGGQGGGAHTAAEWFQPDGRELGLRRILLAMSLLLAASDI
ncbi:MAG: peptidase [Acidobacteria bacterium]|jgi:acetylornithine deacetylase/succinyl-diaminopimelate desuccinylase-like protein|nr:MAG: peptidase [Acidobacteriota bacterium]